MDPAVSPIGPSVGPQVGSEVGPEVSHIDPVLQAAIPVYHCE
jgi:hypothetical protein